MLRIIRNSKGITLIEMSIAMLLALIGIVGSCSLLSNVHGTLMGGSETVQVQQDARIILENIARELRESDYTSYELKPDINLRQLDSGNTLCQKDYRDHPTLAYVTFELGNGITWWSSLIP